MELVPALAQIGAEIVKTEERDGSHRLWCRVPTKGAGWGRVLLLFLGSQAGWSADVSKSYFVKDGSIRFLWRIILSGDTAAAQAALVHALDSVKAKSEVTEMPLIGRATYTMDRAKGKIKGAYGTEENMASTIGIG